MIVLFLFRGLVLNVRLVWSSGWLGLLTWGLLLQVFSKHLFECCIRSLLICLLCAFLLTFLLALLLFCLIWGICFTWISHRHFLLRFLLDYVQVVRNVVICCVLWFQDCDVVMLWNLQMLLQSYLLTDFVDLIDQTLSELLELFVIFLYVVFLLRIEFRDDVLTLVLICRWLRIVAEDLFHILHCFC